MCAAIGGFATQTATVAESSRGVRDRYWQCGKSRNGCVANRDSMTEASIASQIVTTSSQCSERLAKMAGPTPGIRLQCRTRPQQVRYNGATVTDPDQQKRIDRAATGFGFLLTTGSTALAASAQQSVVILLFGVGSWFVGSGILYARAFSRSVAPADSAALPAPSRTGWIATAIVLSLLPVLFLILSLATPWDSDLAVTGLGLLGLGLVVFLISIVLALPLRR